MDHQHHFQMSVISLLMGVMGVQNENNILDQNSSLNYRFYGWILFIHVRSIHLEHLKNKK